MDHDAIVIGAGHNGLVTAAYLAQAGHDVAVFEKQDRIGGAIATTSDVVPGYRFDLGGSAHILIRLTPIVDELELGRYGLEYLELDPLLSAPSPDGPPLFIWRDADRTAAELEAAYPGAGENYRAFLDDWSQFARAMKNMFLSEPTPWQLGRSMLFETKTPLPWAEAARTISRPYGDVVREYFDEPRVQALMAWMAAQSGPPPGEPLTAPFLLWHPLYHEGGIARPRGGSGQLADALARHIQAHGGEIHTGAGVDQILVENGRAVGVRAGGHPYTAEAVCSATHIRETYDRLLPDAHRPPEAGSLRVGNGFGAMLRLALDAPVEYRNAPDGPSRTGLQMLCRSPEQIQRAYGDFKAGRPAQDPPLVAMTFSAVDDTLAPEGGDVLWLWGQYFPYELDEPSATPAGNGPAGNEEALQGASWDEAGPRVEKRLLDAFERYAPGTREKIVGRLFQSPAWLEENLGLRRGNVMHLEMALDQMFAARPSLEHPTYRGPVDGLFLSGASTHPGGGIMGVAGRNAARVMLRDLEAWTPKLSLRG
jgi:phytoene dehydrogenase-like protein